MAAETSKQPPISLTTITESVRAIFDDPESRRNITGLFDLLLKIDRRLDAQKEAPKAAPTKAPKP
jgi:hypothetical protein